MKLRNKKTGEIGELQITEKHCAVAVGNGTASCGLEIYSSIAELNEEWEDYEKPKTHWEILGIGVPIERINEEDALARDLAQKEIGNYFETKEEAEKAVEKLKAWKRLKDKGFRFEGWSCITHCIRYTIDYDNTIEQIIEADDDLDLLFESEKKI